MFAPRVTRHTSIRYSSSCHTCVNMSASIFFTAAMIRAFRATSSRGNGGTNPRSLTNPQRRKSRKYVSYGFPIINFCNTGVLYETPCTYAYCLLAYSMHNQYVKYQLLWIKTPDDGQYVCPKHVELRIEIKLRNSASCWLLLYEYTCTVNSVVTTHHL
jgi:hypothetical protein